jgi:hypothetical protein
VSVSCGTTRDAGGRAGADGGRDTFGPDGTALSGGLPEAALRCIAASTMSETPACLRAIRPSTLRSKVRLEQAPCLVFAVE